MIVKQHFYFRNDVFDWNLKFVAKNWDIENIINCCMRGPGKKIRARARKSSIRRCCVYMTKKTGAICIYAPNIFLALKSIIFPIWFRTKRKVQVNPSNHQFHKQSIHRDVFFSLLNSQALLNAWTNTSIYPWIASIEATLINNESKLCKFIRIVVINLWCQSFSLHHHFSSFWIEPHKC